jgi:hypothetical protein
VSAEIPDFVTHYHLPGTPPFLNLSTLPEPELNLVLRLLEAGRTQGDHRRVFGTRYMDVRRRTESKMRRLFEAGGGLPQRSAPHYFVLGESPWYRGLAAGMQAVTMALGDLPSATTSFTYPDSFTAMSTLAEFGVSYEPRPYHGRVYRLDELADVVDRYGLPVDTTPTIYEGYETRPFEKYIEVQLWSDGPIAGLLRGGIADRV